MEQHDLQTLRFLRMYSQRCVRQCDKAGAGDIEAGKQTEALEGFQNVVKMEEGKSEWCVRHLLGEKCRPAWHKRTCAPWLVAG